VRSDEKTQRDDSYAASEDSAGSQWDPAEAYPSSPRGRELGVQRRSPDTAVGTDNAVGYAKRLGTMADRLDEMSAAGGSPGRDAQMYRTRVNVGKVKLCGSCGSVMVRSTRMVLSPIAGVALILLGAGFMAAYGLATNFLHTPWYLKFGLPALYYVGSLFVGVGILFFFIREKVWKCYKCREIRKR